MLDIKRIRENFEEVKAGVERRCKGDFGIDRVRELDIRKVLMKLARILESAMILSPTIRTTSACRIPLMKED